MADEEYQIRMSGQPLHQADPEDMMEAIRKINALDGKYECSWDGCHKVGTLPELCDHAEAMHDGLLDPPDKEDL